MKRNSPTKTVTRYRIRDWSDIFENSQSRQYQRLSWVPVPNKHDGKSFRRLIAHADGPALYGAWLLIVQVASKCPVRGVLADTDGPLDAEDLAAKTGCPASVFTKAFELLTHPKIAWLEVEQLPADQQYANSGPTAALGNLPLNRTEPKYPESEKTNTSAATAADRATRTNGQADQAKQLYDAYPRHVGKADALKAINAALKRERFDVLMGAVTAFAQSPKGRSGQYCPHPATWFKQERWNDDRTEWERTEDTANNGNRSQQRLTGSLGAIASFVQQDGVRPGNGHPRRLEANH